MGGHEVGRAAFPRQIEEKPVARLARSFLHASRWLGTGPGQGAMGKAQGFRLSGNENGLGSRLWSQAVVDRRDEDPARVGPGVPARQEMHHGDGIGATGDGGDDAVGLVEAGKKSIEHGRVECRHDAALRGGDHRPPLGRR